MNTSLLLLDACCAINLLASGRAADILEGIPFDVSVVRLVLEQEVLHVGPEEEPGLKEMEAAPARELVVEISLQPLVDRGLLGVVDPTSEPEYATYVDLALELDDGEAMTGAIAIHRRALLATDDKKAIRVLGRRLPESSIVRTSELLKDWADQGIPTDQVREALRNVERRASFRPPRNDPLWEWWKGNSLRRGH